MPANNPPLNSVRSIFGIAAIAASVLVTGLAFGQTELPSQRYLPVRQQAFQEARPTLQQPMAQPQRSLPFDAARRLPTLKKPAPAPAPSIPSQEGYQTAPNTQNLVRPTSFQDSEVPPILGRMQPRPEASRESVSQQNDEGAQFVAPAVSTVSNAFAKPQVPEDIAGKLSLKTSSLPSVSDNTLDNLESQTTAGQDRPITSARLPLMPQEPIKTSVPVNVAPQANGPESSFGQPLRSTALEVASERVGGEKEAQANALLPASGNQPNISATQFVADINKQAADNGAATEQEPQSDAPTLVAKQSGDPLSPAMQLATGHQPQYANTDQGNRLQPAANGLPIVDDAEIKLAAPALDIVAVGPESIGINKPSKYRIVVRNNSTIKAERVLVGVNLPEWVEIENVSMTSGGKEITDGKDRARLVWNVDQVPGNSSQTLTVTAVPRKAEMFDVSVEWTLVPRTGKTAIRVTEPKLEMSISGPREVLYGETALYHVAVRNPGTGAAENVTIMLPEALGGERQPLGIIPAGKEKNLQIELLARTAGDLNLVATAAADGNLKTSAERALKVRRANLQVSMVGPPLKYAGGIAEYIVKINNSGDATATDVVTAVALPEGVKYLKGIEAVKLIEGGMRWTVGSLDPQQTKTYRLFCQLDTSGDLQLEVGTQGKGDLAASAACLTTVETIADLVLTVADPKGPLPTGERVPYTIKIRNRGTKAAKNVDLVMLFSEGIEPREAKGLTHQIVPGQVKFSPIPEIAPGQEVAFEVSAEAIKSGTHIFRAQLRCEESDSREMAEGTTRFFGDDVAVPAASTAKAIEESKPDNSFQK